MRLEILEEGFVSKRSPETSRPLAVGSRTAQTSTGEILCSYMVQSALGINDFVPVLSRSRDAGKTWEEESPIWPDLVETHSLFGSISRAPSGELFMYGISTPITEPGESFWCESTQGMKQNNLFWARSVDEGRSFTNPALIAMPLAGSAEAPGALCVTREGRWCACYAPYNNFDANVSVDRAQIVLLASDDCGMTWKHTPMLRFSEQDSGGAEAWVIQLSDGRLLGTCWHVDNSNQRVYPNAYAISSDEGRTWSATRSTEIMGQSTALCPLPNGKALFVYNRRKEHAGVWLAIVSPTVETLGVELNEAAWLCQTATQRDTSGELGEWTDFAFGEPSVMVLSDGTLFLTFWSIQPSGQGIRYLKVKIMRG
jgi:hypothetical protein